MHSNACPAESRRTLSKPLYRSLLAEGGRVLGQPEELTLARSREFLCQQLDDASRRADDFPVDVRNLRGWLERANADTGAQYRKYLDGRRAGQGRRYFSSRSHAFYFLRAVAPTKLVDGAWLYGLLQSCTDPRLHGLVRTYLEELGDGNPRQNHVRLYRDLLRAYDCEPGDALLEENFVQGAIQLSLAHHAGEFLPEIIGFNLGYEQLPLHLLITAYELNELDIDPYYFTLHVTVDNAASGHARKAVDGVLAAWPHVGERHSGDYYRRIANGFKLGSMGLDTLRAIAIFDLETELLDMLKRKAVFGAQLHSDYCRVGGRSISQWLATPDQLPDFIAAMQSVGWIKRGEPVENSRLWRLICNDQAPMFGVFTAYEVQLLRDWIEPPSNGEATAPSAARLPIANRFRRRAEAAADVDATIEPLDDWFHGSAGADQTMKSLIGHLSPANHHLPAGLHATRAFARRLAGRI